MSTQVSHRHHREGEGKSDHSWIKHSFAGKSAGAQVAAFRRIFPAARMVLIDGNAGDAKGVDLPQSDLFDDQHSQPTAQMLAALAHEYNASVCLCERNRNKRDQLRRSFPHATIVATHAEAAEFACGGFNYALWLSDPCGPAGHGIPYMRAVATQIMRSDFIIVFNELSSRRFIGVAHSPYWRTHQKYTPMLEPAWWLSQLPKRFLARTPVIKQSSGFHFRLLVVSDFITDGVKRLRNIEIIQRGAK